MKLKSDNASAAIIVDKENNYLLQKRNNYEHVFFPGYWGLFGGAKNKSESYLNTIKRELNEEIGFTPKNIKYFIKLSFDLNNTKINRYFYVCKIAKLSKKNIKLNEGEKFGIFSQKKILHNLNNKNLFVPYDHLALWFYINRKKII